MPPAEIEVPGRDEVQSASSPLDVGVAGMKRPSALNLYSRL